MSSSIRSFVLVFLTAAALRAQETPAPTPSPAATPVPAASPSPSPATDSAPAADATPAAAPTDTPATDQAPAPDATPEPTASSEPAPTPAEDIIPIEGQPTAESGAPLDTQDLAPALPDAAYTDPNAIISDEPPAPPSLPTAVENLQQKERQTNIRYREVRVEAEKDPKVVDMFQQAGKAASTEARRAAQREYYRLLFKKMVSIDNSLESKCAQMEAAYLRRLAQERAEPTIPLNPPPTPEPLSN